MSVTATSLAERFTSQEYISFKEIVERSSLDNKLVIKNQNVIYGKQKVKVPSFVVAQDLIEYLEGERVKYLFEYNDVYEKILTSEKPQVFKTQYEKLSTTISNLEVLIDEINALIDNRNTNRQSDVVDIQLKEVSSKMVSVAFSLQENGVLDTVKVKQLAELFHIATRLHTAQIEAKNEPYLNYVIYELPSKKKDSLVSSSRTSKRSSLTMLSKVKPNIKKLMIDKLEITT